MSDDGSGRHRAAADYQRAGSGHGELSARRYSVRDYRILEADVRVATCLLDSTTGPGYSSPGIMTVPNPRSLPRRSRFVRFVAAFTVAMRALVFVMAASAVPSEPRSLAPHFESGGAQHYEHDEHNCLVCVVQHMVSIPPRVARPVVETADVIRPTAVVTREVSLARRWSPADPRGPPVAL